MHASDSFGSAGKADASNVFSPMRDRSPSTMRFQPKNGASAIGGHAERGRLPLRRPRPLPMFHGG